MDLVFRIFGYVSVVLLIVSVGAALRNLRRERRIAMAPRTLLLPVVLAAGTLLLYLILLDARGGATYTWLPLLGGALAGVGWSRTTDLQVAGGRVVGTRRAALSLVPWLAAFVFTQVLGLAGSGLTVPLGFPLLFAATGLTIGEHLALLQRRAALLGGGPPAAAPVTPVLAVLGIAVLLLAGPAAHAADGYSFERIAAGEEPFVTVEITGSGQGYYGDSLSAFIRNDTGRTITVEVETGLRLDPEDPAAQTMYTVGQRFEVPPGGATRLIKAFCGEQHDRGPSSTDTYRVTGRAGEEWTRALRTIRDNGLSDSRDAQDWFWKFTDGNDTTGNSVARELEAEAARTPLRRDAGEAATAVGAGAVGTALILDRSHRRRFLTGPHALKHLTSHGWRTISTEEGTQVVVPDDWEHWPSGTDGVACETRTVVDPITGQPVTVIDPSREVVVKLPDGTTPGGSPPPPPEEEGSPEPAVGTEMPPAEPPTVKRIDDAEVRRMVDWGVQHNRSPQDIQRDVDARNQSLGGSGTVPVDEPPVRVRLPDGEVTLSAEEARTYLEKKQTLDDNLKDARLIWSALRKLGLQNQQWVELDRGTGARWIAGTVELIRQNNRAQYPESFLARQKGYSTVDEMLVKEYGKPTWSSYDTRHHASLEEAVREWERGAGYARLAEERSRVVAEARRALQEMTPRLELTGERPTFPERVMVGREVRSPTLWRPPGSPTRNLSWFNRPVQRLQENMARQDQMISTLRAIRERADELRHMEEGFARRIR